MYLRNDGEVPHELEGLVVVVVRVVITRLPPMLNFKRKK